MARQAGDVVHYEGRWPCQGATVAVPRRRGLDLFQRHEGRGIVVLEAVPHGPPGTPGTWHRAHRIPDNGPRLGPPRGYYRAR